MRVISSLVITSSLVAACQMQSTQSSETNSVRSVKDPNMTLVAVSMSPVNQDNQTAEIVSSCAYELNLSSANDKLVSPLNKHAYDSKRADFMQKLKYYGGGMIMFSGSALGGIIAGGSSAATLIFPPAFYGVPIGFMITAGSVATGGGLIVSAQNDLDKKLTTFDRMVKLSTGNHQTDIWYDDYKETMKSAQNTNKKCPQMTTAVLKKLSKLDLSKPATSL